MIHQYKNNGYNIVMDIASGSVHVVDDVVYDAVALLEPAMRMIPVLFLMLLLSDSLLLPFLLPQSIPFRVPHSCTQIFSATSIAENLLL